MDPITSLALIFIGAFLASSYLAARLRYDVGPLVFFFVYSAFSGYLNNVFEKHPVVHLSRFAVMGLVGFYYLNRFGSRFLSRYRLPILRPLYYFVGLYGLQMFNPAWSSIQVGILSGVVGHLQHTLPIAMLFAGLLAFRRFDQLLRLIGLVVMLSVVMALYGLYQYHQGYDYVAGLGRMFEETLEREETWIVDAQGQVQYDIKTVRPMSFAQDAGAAARFYLAGIILSLPFLAYPGLRSGIRILALAGIALQGTALTLTLVRSAFVALVFALVLILLLFRQVRLLMVGVVMVIVFSLLSESGNQFIGARFSGLTDPATYVRERGMQVEAMWWVATTFPMGTGIGRVGPGTGRFVTPADLAYSVPQENYFVCIMFETGVPGGILMVLIFWEILKLCRSICLGRHSVRVRTLGIPLAVFLIATLLTLFSGPILYAAPVNYSFWFIVGALYKLLLIEKTALLEGQDRSGPPPSTHGPTSAQVGLCREESAG